MAKSNKMNAPSVICNLCSIKANHNAKTYDSAPREPWPPSLELLGIGDLFETNDPHLLDWESGSNGDEISLWVYI